jgi:hypothetical protein
MASTSGHKKWSEISAAKGAEQYRRTWRYRWRKRWLIFLTKVYRVFPWLPDPW